MKLNLLSVGCAIVASTAFVLTGSAAAERPHFLIIHTDQNRIDCLGAYGNKQIKTPHLVLLCQVCIDFDVPLR